MEQQIHFCTTDDGVRIAYATVGVGPPLVKAANWLSHLEFDWRSPVWRHLLAEFARDHTFIRYDERGNGLSDWKVADLSFDAWVEDLESVVEAAGVDRFPLLGISQGGAVAIAYAVRHPERVSHLILYGAYARGWAKRESAEEIEQRQAQLTLVRLGWGKDNPAFRQLWTTLYAPDATPEQAQSFNDLQRVSTSPENAVALLNVMGNIDVVDLLPQVKVPTLVLHCRDEAGVPFEEGRLIASSILNARFVPLEGRNHLLLEGDPSWRFFVKEVRGFLGTDETSAMKPVSSESGKTAKPDLQRSDLPDRYTIISFLGVGGMGEVYLAQDTKLGRKVALKTLPAEFTNDKERLRRFQMEARAASALNHPNLLTIHEIGAESGAHFIAAEYIDGETLRTRLKRGRMKIDDALDVAQQAAFALTAAHGAGILHRDIKPENIMVRHDGIVKVLDFGLAKLLEDHAREMIDHEADTRALVLTDPGRVLGTPAYMSPEQARGMDLDGRTDIWSLGVVLYEMVAGRPPFRGETKSHTVVSILESEPAPLATLAPDAPPELQRIVRKALTKDRDSRYQTARDLMIDLKSLRRDLDIQSEMQRSGVPEISVAETKAREPGKAASAASNISSAQDTSLAEPDPTRGDASPREGSIGYRVGALIAMLLLAVGASSVWYYLQRHNAGGAADSIDSMAVMPFLNEGGDQNAEFLSDGITDSLINSLSQLPHMKVIARSSVFRYKGQQIDPQKVAAELGVKALMTGRVLQRGGTLSISVELVNARDNTHLWGQQYTRPAADIFALQAEIAREVSNSLRLTLTSAESERLAKRYTENINAYQSYLQGRSLAARRTREDLLSAMRLYQKAIAEDGNYALAYAGIAEVYANLGSRGFLAPSEGRRKAEEAIHKAIALDDGLAEAHVPVGEIAVLFAPYDFPLADRELQKAVELSPSLASAHQYLGNSYILRGRYEEALAEFEKARELDPLSSIMPRVVASYYYLNRDYPRAWQFLRQANELGPPFGTFWEVEVYIQNGMSQEALDELAKLKEDKDNPILIESRGKVYAALGKRAEALQAVTDLATLSGASQSQSQHIAAVYALLNEKEQALTSLERGAAAGEMGMFLKDEPVWDSIRSDPRFANLIHRLGL